MSCLLRLSHCIRTAADYHEVTLDWLSTLPNVDGDRIGFYGLSYGGKTAMRVPAVEKRYCLSICSGDFNEWIGKNVSVDLDRSYMARPAAAARSEPGRGTALPPRRTGPQQPA